MNCLLPKKILVNASFIINAYSFFKILLHSIRLYDRVVVLEIYASRDSREIEKTSRFNIAILKDKRSLAFFK